VGDLFDLHAPLRVCHDHDALGFPIQHQAQVQLSIDRHRGLDVKPMHHPPFRPGLMGDQPLAEKSFGRLADLVLTGAELDAPRLTAGPRVDLRFHRPARAANLRCPIHRLLRAVGDTAPRYGHAEAGEELFGLVFVDVHNRSGKRGSELETIASRGAAIPC
jgi:hypothetical protein